MYADFAMRVDGHHHVRGGLVRDVGLFIGSSDFLGYGAEVDFTNWLSGALRPRRPPLVSVVVCVV
jgi:hypothetical protein